MPLESNVDKTAKAPDESVLSSLNLNSVADKSGSKPVQIADDGVFNRNRGQGQVPPGGRAHPFLDTGVSKSPDGKLLVGQDPPANRTPVKPFLEHAAEQAPKLKDLGDQQQAQDNAAARRKIVGNALALGFADNALYAKELPKHWDEIGQQGGIMGFAEDALRIGSVPAFALATGAYASRSLKRGVKAEKASTVTIYDGHRANVISIKDAVDNELATVRTDPASAKAASLLQEKSTFLNDFLHGDQNSKLKALSQFNKDRPGAFLPAESDSIKAMAETENKLASVTVGVPNEAEMKGAKGLLYYRRSNFAKGMLFVGGSLGLNLGLKEGMHLLPGEHHETDRIFAPTVQESVIQGVIGAAPIRNLSAKLALGSAAWLAAREEKMTWGEAVLTGVGVAGLTAAAALVRPLRSAVPKALFYEACAFGIGRAAHLVPIFGTEIPELINTSTDAWNAMKNDSLKRTGSSLSDAVDAFDLLGTKWRGVLGNYDRDVVINGVQNQRLAILHGNIELNNYDNIITNSRTGMVLSESLGNTVLKAGLTGDTKSDLLETYHQQSSDEKKISNDTIIASNQGDLDLTSRAARSYMQALAFADVTMANMKAAQHQANGDASAKNITDADIKAVADEKAKIEKVMREKILRSAPGAEAHDIQDIVEGSDGFFVKGNKFKLTDYKKDDQNGYSHMVTALENKAYSARDSWLPNQLNGPNAEISKQYVAKIFRDAAVMRLAYTNAELETQTANGMAAKAQSVTDMINYMQNSDLGRQQDPDHAKSDTKSIITAAWQLDKDNPDMKAIMAEYDRLATRILQFNANYINNHNGQAPSQNPIANPFGIQPPANAH